jgi:hypothetical protein
MTRPSQWFAAEIVSRTQAEPDRGDVPGWVLVTVMTAGLVTTLWIVADDQLRQIFSSALGRVTGP